MINSIFFFYKRICEDYQVKLSTKHPRCVYNILMWSEFTFKRKRMFFIQHEGGEGWGTWAWIRFQGSRAGYEPAEGAAKEITKCLNQQDSSKEALATLINQQKASLYLFLCFNKVIRSVTYRKLRGVLNEVNEGMVEWFICPGNHLSNFAETVIHL